jgi:CrcB protein
VVAVWKDLLLIGVAGAVGSLARYGVSSVIDSMCRAKFPWGILVVNLSGCFLFGLVWSLADHRLVINHQTRLILLTGFMGAYTTFSTLAFDTSRFVQNSQWGLAAANGLGQLVAGVISDSSTLSLCWLLDICSIIRFHSILVELLKPDWSI